MLNLVEVESCFMLRKVIELASDAERAVTPYLVRLVAVLFLHAIHAYPRHTL